MGAKLPTKDEIFNAAAEIADADERAAYLQQACGSGLALRAEIEELLDHDRSEDSLLDRSIPGLGAIVSHPITEQPGTIIGPYELLQQIGEGGFGVVFLAEQERPVRRRVALKVVKPGMDTREVIARFEAERQALAMMDHPNIAKVHDAGATENGRPYFVMELVQGVPITEYCDQCNLTTEDRLKLFVTVCQAVQHAHQKGVIHRDIKPTNVLVAWGLAPFAESAEQKVPVPLPHNEKPLVKIIDFGVAKAIDQRLTEHTLMTAFAQILGTPLYMSPEQAELSPLGVDTRSDIYSLGVLLYELLTGTTPFDKDRLHAASYDELRRIIREEEPPRPSTRINTLAADMATTVAERRHTDVRRLSQQVRGELDWIVMKCLEKDRNRRYETPNSLARDVERYLHDEPIQACPPSATYRLRKYARRNKALLSVLGLLLCGLLFLAYGNIAINRERDAKSMALADANAVSRLLQEMLSSSYPDQVKSSQYTVRELLDDFSAKMGDHLAGQPEAEAAMRSAIGRAYWRLRVLDRAELNLKKAIELRRQALGENDERVADSLVEYANTLAEQGRIDEGESCIREALSIYKQYDSEPRVINATADALYFLVLAQLQRGDKAGYRATCNALINLPVHSAYIATNARPVWPLCLAPDALDDMSRLVKRAEEFAADNSINGTDLNQAHNGPWVLGSALFRAGRYREAAERLEQSIAAYPTVSSKGFDTLNYQRLVLAMTKWQLGERDAARRLFAETKLAVDRELQAPSTLWHRRTSLELLRDEADALIEPKVADEAVEHKSPDSESPSNPVKQAPEKL